MNRRVHAAAVIGLVLALLVSACGGGGGDGDSAATSAPPTPDASAIDGSGPSDADTDDDADEDAGQGEPVPSAGCQADAVPAATVEEQRDIVVDGVERWYLLTAPEPTSDRPRPLVLDFHGIAEGAILHATMSGFSDLAIREDFVVAFPNGLGTPVGWSASPTDDAGGHRAYTAALLDEIAAEHCIDESRVYAIGFSNGAMMSSLLACVMSDRFAAVAPVAGIESPEPCPTERPVPILTIHGTDDPILMFNGGIDGAYLASVLSPGDESAQTTAPPTTRPFDLAGEGYPAAVAAWADRNGCDPTPTDEEISDVVLHRVFDCPAGADVEFYVVRGGGHSWPGSELSESIGAIVGMTTFDIDASELAWEFFQRFQMPAA